ncbi:hypothetical protein CAC42_1803 [Sphaceloma murrayae]|uniref:Uncharacterized protein n=1 Tax=Sphaceloma murrayae TaxID=2082308 RepID=A0A2K1QVI0_9PEZI|nr:hypothetical protein CAC42_1803 [Sphaceloma murrayae]
MHATSCLVAAAFIALAASKPVLFASEGAEIITSDLLALHVLAPGEATLSKRKACEPQPLGAGPVSTPDDVRTFAKNPFYANAALSAETPEGYNVSFTNWNASNQAYGYLGYHLLDTYNTSVCASRCDSIEDCLAFNIYFERDPTVDPQIYSCPNPPSTTNIKCVFWSGPINKANANNYGQWRGGFQVAIAGSNGYVSKKIATPAGYADPVYLGNSAINALSDCNGGYTFMGLKIWPDVPFDVKRCAQACTIVSDENRATIAAAADGSQPQTCQFFNTYQLVKNGAVVGQYCALYNSTWSASTATNYGGQKGNDKFTIQYSYAFSNVTDPGLVNINRASSSQA